MKWFRPLQNIGREAKKHKQNKPHILSRTVDRHNTNTFNRNQVCMDILMAIWFSIDIEETINAHILRFGKYVYDVESSNGKHTILSYRFSTKMNLILTKDSSIILRIVLCGR